MGSNPIILIICGVMVELQNLDLAAEVRALTEKSGYPHNFNFGGYMLEGFKSVEDVFKEYEIHEDEMYGIEILAACYFQASYEGSSAVLYKKHDQLYLVHAGHCSCYGLGGQFEGKPFTEEELKTHLEEADEWEEELKWIHNFCKDYFKWQVSSVG